jgi:hypothetical protein
MLPHQSPHGRGVQVKYDTAHPVDDLVHQYHYVGVAAEV